MTTPTYSARTEIISVTSTTTGADADLLYTCPVSYDAEVTLILVTNGATTTTFNVQLYHEDMAAWHYISRLHSIAAGTSLNVLDGSPLFLHAGDKIAVYKTGGTFDATISVKQYFNPTRRL
jgi:hypothetical protein|tara:strand:+ start:3806 stop:4168 length:363 start_codon:yes stop_codon:yes gene_type:complete